MSKFPFVRIAFSDELENSVPTCPAFVLFGEKNTPDGRNREYSLSSVAQRIMSGEVSRLKNLRGNVLRGFNL